MTQTQQAIVAALTLTYETLDAIDSKDVLRATRAASKLREQLLNALPRKMRATALSILEDIYSRHVA